MTRAAHFCRWGGLRRFWVTRIAGFPLFVAVLPAASAAELPPIEGTARAPLARRETVAAAVDGPTDRTPPTHPRESTQERGARQRRAARQRQGGAASAFGRGGAPL